MKRSTIILVTTLVFLLIAMVVSNILLKQEYGKIDKSDLYWNYEKILNTPFHHLNIQGGNLTHIAFEQSNSSSIRVFKNWRGLEDKRVSAKVTNDTLFVSFPGSPADQYEKEYMQRMTLVRIFTPDLLSVTCDNSNLRMLKTRQTNFRLHLKGRSNVEVESYTHHFDSLTIAQEDSSRVVFRMSDNFKTNDPKALVREQDVFRDPIGSIDEAQSHSWEALSVSYVDARITGVSILDLGHAEIQHLKLNISDTSAIILSGNGLRKFASLKP